MGGSYRYSRLIGGGNLLLIESSLFSSGQRLQTIISCRYSYRSIKYDFLVVAVRAGGGGGGGGGGFFFFLFFCHV